MVPHLLTIFTGGVSVFSTGGVSVFSASVFDDEQTQGRKKGCSQVSVACAAVLAEPEFICVNDAAKVVRGDSAPMSRIQETRTIRGRINAKRDMLYSFLKPR